jgi:hypothetical protein
VRLENRGQTRFGGPPPRSCCARFCLQVRIIFFSILGSFFVLAALSGCSTSVKTDSGHGVTAGVHDTGHGVTAGVHTQ